MITKPQDIFEHKLNKIFQTKNKGELDLVFDIISLILYSNERSTCLSRLYNLISLFDGETIKFPNKLQLKNSVILALLYYYREIKNKSWEEIKKEFPFEINSISYGIQIKNLNNYIKQRIQSIYKQIEKTEGEENEERNRK